MTTAKEKERANGPGASAAGIVDAGASIGRPASTTASSTSSSSASAAALKGSASAFALSMRARAKAASERAAASLKAADLGGVWHGAVDAAGAALAATEEKIRKLGSAAAAGAAAASSSSPSLSALCKSEAAARPCPRLVLSACCSIAAEAARAASERAFVADAPSELVGFVLAELDDAAGVALPPPGTSPAIMATALKQFLASLPDPLLPVRLLPDFIGAGVEGAPAAAAAAAAAALPAGPSAVLSLLVETLSRVATARGGEEAGAAAAAGAAPTPAELAASLVPCVSWRPGAPRPSVSYAPGGVDGGGAGGGGGSQPASPAGGGGGGSDAGSGGLVHRHGRSRAELTPGEAAAVARAVEILILTAADRAAGGGGLGGGGPGFGFGGGAAGSLGSAASFGSEPASPMGFFGGNAAAAGGGGGEGATEG
jgi:hypothetical protein